MKQILLCFFLLLICQFTWAEPLQHSEPAYTGEIDLIDHQGMGLIIDDEFFLFGPNLTVRNTEGMEKNRFYLRTRQKVRYQVLGKTEGPSLIQSVEILPRNSNSGVINASEED